MKNLNILSLIVILASILLIGCGSGPLEPNFSLEVEVKCEGVPANAPCPREGVEIAAVGTKIDESGGKTKFDDVTLTDKTSQDGKLTFTKEQGISPGPWNVKVTSPAPQGWEFSQRELAVNVNKEGVTNLSIILRKSEAAQLPDLKKMTSAAAEARQALEAAIKGCREVDSGTKIEVLRFCKTTVLNQKRKAEEASKALADAVRTVEAANPAQADIASAKKELGEIGSAIDTATALLTRIEGLLQRLKVDISKLTSDAKMARANLEKKIADCAKLTSSSKLEELKACKADLTNLQRKLQSATTALANGINTVEANDPSNSGLASAKKELEDGGKALDTLTSLLTSLETWIQQQAAPANTGTAVIYCKDFETKKPLRCKMTEVGYNWAVEGKTTPSCTADTSGVCRFVGLALGQPYEFKVEMAGYYTQNTKVNLSTTSTKEFVVELVKAQQASDSLICSSLTLQEGEKKDLDCHLKDKNGGERDVKSGLTCKMKPSGVASASNDCFEISGLKEGCATLEINFQGLKTTSRIRVYKTPASLPSCL